LFRWREADHERLLDELRAGEKAVVATIAAMIAPYLGVGVTQMLSAAIAVAITLIGLMTWCVMHNAQRAEIEKGRRSS
jgi:hypothetical protein